MSKKNPSLDELKAKLAHLDALIADGTLKGESAQKSRDEVERQIVAHVMAHPVAAAPAVAAAAPAAPERAPRGLMLSVLTFVLAFGLVGYAAMGNRDGWSVGPGENVAATPDGAGHSTQAAQIEAMVAKLQEKLKAKPDDAEGWTMLGRTYTAQGKFAEALPAFKKVTELKPNEAQGFADLADATAMVNNRTLEGEPEKLILKALQLDPANVKALSLAGTVAFNKNDFKSAAGLWQRAVEKTDPNSEFAKQLQGALAEARERAGLPPLPGSPAAATAAAAPAATGDTKPLAPLGASVSGRVALGASLKGKANPDDLVFIFARAAGGSRMPLAMMTRKVSDLPFDFTLDDSNAIAEAAKLSSAPQVIVGARIGKAIMPQPGDPEALSAPVALGAQGVSLEIGAPKP